MSAALTIWNGDVARRTSPCGHDATAAMLTDLGRNRVRLPDLLHPGDL